MNKEIKKLECPTKEDLSAFFDNELDSSLDYSDHIKNCSKCQETIKSYKEIERHIKESLTIEAPQELSRKVMKRIAKYKNEKNNPQLIYYPQLLKFAAMIAIIAFSIFILTPKDEKRSNKITTSINSLSLTQKEIKKRALSTQEIPKENDIYNNANDTIDLNNFFPASTKPIQWLINKNKSEDQKRAVTIDKKVEQVWLLQNPEIALRKIKKLSKKIIKTDRMKSGNIKLTFALTKIELVYLVKELISLKYKLLSPSQPQPEENRFTGNKEDRVIYTAILTTD